MTQRIIVAALLIAACRSHEAIAPLPSVKEGSGGPALPDGGVHHTTRLALISWRSDGGVIACGRRTGDLAQPGRVVKCVAVDAAGGAMHPAEADAKLARDASPVEAAPGTCRVLVDDISGSPGGPAARVTLVGPTARQLLAEWTPAREDNGDYFALETSFSSDGKWMAVIRCAVGLGEGDQTVDVLGLTVRPAPTCR